MTSSAHTEGGKVRIIRERLYVGITLIACGPWWGASAHAECADSDYVSARPSPASPAGYSAITAVLGCYSVFTGDFANCAFTYKVVGLAYPESDPGNNGGHVGHTGVRPLVLADSRNPGGAVLYPRDADSSPLRVSGQTQEVPPFQQAVLRHPAPQVSGRLAVDMTITAPPGQFFCFLDPAGRTLLTYAVIDVGIPGLEPLPPTGTDYQVIRGGVAEHPDGTNGTSGTLRKLLEIAGYYHSAEGSKLSVNDLSLPAGGLFDINSNWQPPHDTHRDGLDSDINRQNVDGSFSYCEDDVSLAWAVQKSANGRARPYLYCEKHGFKHIDF
ncbi:MAG: hypothetical protein AB7G76_08635 [Steroidobacteraceae bacterium]